MQTSKRRKLPAYRRQKQRQRFSRSQTATSTKINSDLANTVVMPVIETSETQTELICARSNKQQFRFVFIAVTLMTVILVWLMQNSLITYYQLAYHKNQDLSQLEFFPVWQKGALLGAQLNESINSLNQQISEFNREMMTGFNDMYVYTPAYLAQKKQQNAQTEKQHRQIAKIASKENMIKSDFSLNNDDQVFFAGDSMMQGVAPHVQRWLSEKYGIKSINLSKQSTGLTYTRFFNWGKTISDTLDNNPNIKILVVFLGPNDPWDMPNPNAGSFIRFKTPEWESIYRNRIKDIIDNARQHHVTVLWLTPPNMRREKLNEQMIYLRDLINHEVSKNHGYVIDTRIILGNSGIQFSDILIQTDGLKIKTRSADGIHFSLQGQKLIAKTIFERFNITAQTHTDGTSDEH